LPSVRDELVLQRQVAAETKLQLDAALAAAREMGDRISELETQLSSHPACAGTPSALAEAVPPVSASPDVKVPPQLQALVSVLPAMSEESLRSVLGTIALHVHEKVQRPLQSMPEVATALRDAGMENGKKDCDAVLRSCEFLIRQASKAGVGSSKLASRLRPLGFTPGHLAAVESVVSSKYAAPKR